MIGRQVPLVLLPRYTSFVGTPEFVGAQDFVTVPIDVAAFEKCNVTLWRGPLIGTAYGESGPSFQAYFEFSNDAAVWTPMSPADPGADVADDYLVEFQTRRWFRVRVRLVGTNVGVSCWCVGLLELRVS